MMVEKGAYFCMYVEQKDNLCTCVLDSLLPPFHGSWELNSGC